MKRIISTTLVLIFLNYLAGYYIIFWVLKRQADSQMTQRLDADNYSDNETVTFKFPYSLPYNNDWKSFERISGSFQYHGEFFKMVKQKLNRDTLYVVCIKDYNVKRISGLVKDFIKVSNDLSSNSKTIKLIGNFSKDYQPTKSTIFHGGQSEQRLEHQGRNESEELKIYLSIPAPPPKV